MKTVSENRNRAFHTHVRPRKPAEQASSHRLRSRNRPSECSGHPTAQKQAHPRVCEQRAFHTHVRPRKPAEQAPSHRFSKSYSFCRSDRVYSKSTDSLSTPAFRFLISSPCDTLPYHYLCFLFSWTFHYRTCHCTFPALLSHTPFIETSGPSFTVPIPPILQTYHAVFSVASGHLRFLLFHNVTLFLLRVHSKGETETGTENPPRRIPCLSYGSELSSGNGAEVELGFDPWTLQPTDFVFHIRTLYLQ